MKPKSKSYLIDTPKHFVAIAASKKTAALGNVNLEIAWNEARRCLALIAHNERR